MSDTVKDIPSPAAETGRADVLKAVPVEAAVRQRIRKEAGRTLAGLSRERPLARTELERLSRDLLRRQGLDMRYLGFTMVLTNNEFWREQFASVPLHRRLLFLPHCLRKPGRCEGTYDAAGLKCASCGACDVSGLKAEAEALGYDVVVAEGTPAVVQFLLDGRADALLGVACLDSLEKAFERVVTVGVPHVAVPLLTEGCVETEAELDLLRHWMREWAGPARVKTRTYVPLLRAAQGLFAEEAFAELLAPCAYPERISRSLDELKATEATDWLAADWLREGGKRFRPFVTLAGYAAMTLGRDALDPDADLTGAFPTAVQRVAVAIEVLHKASLVHDDIEDDDPYRYGRRTLHRRYGVPIAVNVGDHLIGMGYRLISLGSGELGSDCVADIVSHVSEAHLKLCRGQGGELALLRRNLTGLDPREVQTIYALKTAPAFEAALYAGLRMARANMSVEEAHRSMPPWDIRRFCRYLGVAYQVLNDLEDWEDDGANKLVAGRDSLCHRPTLLRAFAEQSADEAARRELADIAESSAKDGGKFQRFRSLYERLGVFERTERLLGKYRERARAEADRMPVGALRELMHFIVETVL